MKGAWEMKSLKDTVKLQNGYEIPCLGYGTYKVSGEEAVAVIKTAISAGYRHIDTATFYGNEVEVGQAIQECDVPREDLFITSKVWKTERGYEKTKASFLKTLEDMQLDYLDLYLIHWPASFCQYENWEEINLETWRAMTELYQEGKIKAIGVSNFLPHHLTALLKTEVKPMVNQIEYHPGEMQEETVLFCKENDILIEAWSPLGRGRIFENEILLELSRKYGKSLPQICLRWELQNGIIPLPKTMSEERMKENADVFDFELSLEDMELINSMEKCGGSGLHPDKQ